MLTVAVGNITPGLQDEKGLADYDVVIKIGNKEPRTIFIGRISKFIRSKGAAELLRAIANEMDATSDNPVTRLCGIYSQKLAEHMDKQIMEMVYGKPGGTVPIGVLNAITGKRKRAKVQKRRNRKDN